MKIRSRSRSIYKGKIGVGAGPWCRIIKIRSRTMVYEKKY